MKRVLYLIPCLLVFLTTSCDWFEFDNYDEPNAKIAGTFIDAVTGDNVMQECYYTNAYGGNIGQYVTGFISAFELGWDYEAAQNWLVKYDGTYQNTSIFAGEYRFEARENNFYPETKNNVVLSKGSNTLDWTVTPYIRIIDPQVVYDQSVQKFKATFKLQYGDNTKANEIFKAMLCCYPDTFVGIYLNNCANDPEASATTGIVADGSTVNTLYIDPALSANSNQFKYSPRTHYFRIAVCAKAGTYNTSTRYNYSPTISIVL